MNRFKILGKETCVNVSGYCKPELNSLNDLYNDYIFHKIYFEKYVFTLIQTFIQIELYKFLVQTRKPDFRKKDLMVKRECWKRCLKKFM